MLLNVRVDGEVYGIIEDRRLTLQEIHGRRVSRNEAVRSLLGLDPDAWIAELGTERKEA